MLMPVNIKIYQIEIIRTRDPLVIQQCDIVVDVGADYDPTRHRYDHHQRSFTDTFSTSFPACIIQTTTRLSSAGLIYKHFGKEIIGHLYAELSPQDVDSVYFRLYEILIEEFDAIDNGINSTSEAPIFITGTSSIYSQIGRLNYVKGKTPKNAEEEYSQFMKAMDLCKALFVDVLGDIIYQWLPSKSVVEDSIAERKGPVVILKAPCSWKDHLFNIEKRMCVSLLYIIYQKENDGMWMAQAIPKRLDSFESRLPFPECWRGLRDEDLQVVTGISGGVFVHASGFLAGAKSLENARQLVESSITLQQEIRSDKS